MKTRAKQQPFLLRAAAVLLLAVLTMTAQTAWADTETVSYIDADGKTKTVSATVLTGNEPVDNSGSIRLAPGWYVVKNTNTDGVDVSYENTIKEATYNGSGTIHIILTDGAEMAVNVTGTDYDIILSNGYPLAIYGQSAGTGRLTLTSNIQTIYPAGGLTINGGIVSATTSNNKAYSTIFSNGAAVTINGGQLTATPGDTGTGISAGSKGTITLGGGTVTSYGGYIGTVTVDLPDGYAYSDGSGNFYNGTLTDAQKTFIAGKTLRPTPDPTHFADNGNGTYTIKTAGGWNVFCDALQDNDTYNRFSGKTVVLGANIGTAQNPVTRMAGSADHEFRGIFDGDQKTLTVSISSSDGNAAPFREIMGATIRNLKVSGTVSGHKHSAGLVSYARGESNSVENTIENCLVDVAVSTIVDTDGDCYLGGIVGHGLQCKLTIRGCAFTGSLTSPHNYTGGLQGWSDGNTLILEDDIFAASSVSAANVGFHPIAIHANNAPTTATVSNVYYTVAPTCTTASRIAAAGKAPHTITAGENVTLALSGTATEYTVSGITAYEGNHGIKYGTTYYAGSDDHVSLTLSNTAPGAPAGYQYGYTATAGTLNGTTLTMPDQDVTISYPLRSTHEAVNVRYVGADGKPASHDAVALDGTEASLGSNDQESWYFVGANISHSGQLNLDGNVKLILADGKTMTASGVKHGIGGDGLLTIYGQAQGTGTLNATGTEDVGIYVVDGVTINGGTVNATGIMADGNVTINGGKVTSTSDPGISSNDGTVTLGWTSPSDRITAESYRGTVKVADGQGLTDGNGNSYSGTLSADDINEKTLQPHWAGSGSSESPYTISRPQELDLLAYRVNGTHGETLQEDGYSGTYFQLAADINYSHATDWDDKNSTENNYEAIGYFDGSNDRDFEGYFDGAGHTVSGIRIHRSGTAYADSYQGLFGRTWGATIRGLRLADTRIIGDDRIGGIVGHTGGGTVTDCHVANDVCIHAVQSYASNHGGIVGYNRGTVSGCTSAAMLTKPDSATGCSFYGGISGANYGTLTGNLAISAVVPAASGNSHGAIVGWNNGGTLQNNYYTACKVASSDVTPSGVGCGYINDSSVADVTANDGAVPGYFITLGENLSIASGATTFVIPAHGETAAVTYHVAAEGAQVTLSTGCEGYQMHNVTYNDGTADHTVSPDGDGKYIFTMPAANVSVTAKVGVIPWAGTGDKDDPYIIQYPSQLDLLAYRVNGTHGEALREDGYKNKYFKLGADINYSHATDWDDANSTENNFEAIGYFDGSNDRYFKGHFDGAGHTVSGIRIYKGGKSSADNNQGLFGQTSGATIRGLRLADTRITGYQYIGGIVGYTGGTVTGCHVANDVLIHAVQSGADHHGGIVGYNRGTIEYCTSAATLTIPSGTTSCRFYGGIAGYNDGNGTLTDNLAIGAVVPAASQNSHGAIVGWNLGTLKNNYYTACKVGSESVTPSGVGCGYINDSSVADVTANDGAVPGYFITLGENLSIASGTTDFTIPAHGETAAVTYHVAAKGAQVTLSTGCEGYQMHNVTYNDGTADHTVSPDGDGKYIFTMPAANVSVTAKVDVIPWAGTGDKDDPYLIKYPSQLDLLAHRVNGTHGETLQADGYSGTYFQLANDINYSHATDWDDATSTENNFEAIGGYYDSTRRYFEGYFDGAGYTVSGIRIYKGGESSADSYQGLFGQAAGATIKGITLADARITGHGETGGIVGYIYADGTINDCHVANNVCIHAVQTDAWHHGGIVGYTLGCTVKNCTSAATLTIPSGDTNCQYYGAIAGYADVSDPLTEGGDLIDNLAIGATVLAVDNAHGAIVGVNHYNRLKHNYYTACKVGSADVTPSGVGSGFRDNSSVADITGDDDAVPAMRDDADNSTAIGLFAALASTDNGHTPIDLGWGAGKYPMQLAGRTLYKDGAWNTLCLPFDLELSGSVLDGDGVDVRTLAGSDFSDGTLTLNFSTTSETTLTAGKPYIVRWAKPDDYVAYDGTNAAECSDLVCPVFTGVTVSTATANVETDYVDFIGILSPTVIYESGTEKTNLYMGADNTLYYPTVEGFQLNACRGYFKLKGISVNGNGNDNGNGVRAFSLNFGDDNATGILSTTNLTNYTNSANAWYSIDGVRLNGKPTKKGLYIHNGNKVVIK